MPQDDKDTFDQLSELSTAHVQLLIGYAQYAVANKDDSDELAKVRDRAKYAPGRMIRATKLFPECFDPNEADSLDWTDIVGCFMLASLDDDDKAQELYNDWNGYTWDLAQLRDAIAAAKPKREQKPSLAERVAGIVEDWRNVALSDELVELTRMACANQLAVIPEVKRILERKP